jgi:hypothetical protein
VTLASLPSAVVRLPQGTFSAAAVSIRWMRHIPRMLIVLALAATVFSSTSTDAGRELFRKMQHAIGGTDRIAAVRDFEQYERADTWLPNGQSHGLVEKRVRFIRPSYLRIDQVGYGDTYVLYFDGKSGWEILPDGTVAELTGGELRFAQGYFNGLQLNRWLEGPQSRHRTQFKCTQPDHGVIQRGWASRLCDQVGSHNLIAHRQHRYIPG